MDKFSLSIADVAAPQLEDSGDFIYRIMQPSAALGAIPGVQTISFTTICLERERLLRDADVLIIHMVGDADLLPIVLERKRRGRLTLFEVSDNFMDFQPSNPASVFYEDPTNRACLMQLLSLCHAMQTTMPELERRFAQFNPKCRVFMNQMDNLGDPERRGDKVVVGWGGSAGHFEDMRRAAPAIISWLKRRPEVIFSIMADVNITSLFCQVPRERIRVTRPGSLQEYYDFVQTLDIGLAPVQEEEFNICRSDVKFMEYASRGVVPVCSNVPTYSRTLRDGATGFLFNMFEEMISTLDLLADDATLRRRVGRAAFNYIRDERSEKACAAQRLDFYAGLISELSLETHGALDWVAETDGAAMSPNSNHFLMRMGRGERLIHDGLFSQYRDGDLKTGVLLLEQAAALLPDFYPARYCLGNALMGNSMERALVELDAALALNPYSCLAPLLIARCHAGRGSNDEAVKVFHLLQERCPEFAPAWCLEGEILHDSDKTDDALKLYERSIEANHYYAPAATMAGSILLTRSEYARAADMFRTALTVMPRSANDRMGLGVSLLMTGDTDGAAENLEQALALNPKLADAARFFLDVCKNDYKRGDMQQAVSHLKRLHELRPSDTETIFWLARSLDRSGLADEALIYWRLLIEADKTGKYSEIARQKLPG